MNFDNYFRTEILQGQDYNANYHEDILTDMLLCAARAESIVRYLSIIFARIGMLHCVWRVLYFCVWRVLEPRSPISFYIA